MSKSMFVVMDEDEDEVIGVCFGYESAVKFASYGHGRKVITTGVLDGMEQWIKDDMEIAKACRQIAGQKGPVIPTKDDAFWWAVAEVGEAADVHVSQSANWLRNYPEKHAGEHTFEYECHQAIMMLILASGDPMESIDAQLKKWGYRSV